MKQYQWLLFDADGTLFDYDQAEGVALRQVFESMGVPFYPGYLVEYRKINQVLWEGVEKGEVKPAIVKVRRFELLLQAFELAHRPEDFSASYLECLAGCAELIDGAAEVVQALRRKYKMAILTNGLQVVQRGRLARSGIAAHFADVIISEEIGFFKPAKEFFETALARLGNPSRREVVMIGDGWNSDIQGAVQYDLDA